MMGSAPEIGQTQARETERIRKALEEERANSIWCLRDENSPTGVVKMRGDALQELITKKREDYEVIKEGEKAGSERKASVAGFAVPPMIVRGAQTVPITAPVVSTEKQPEFSNADKDDRSPEEIAFEKLPDEDLYNLALENELDLPSDAFDRQFTIKALLKAKVKI